MADVTYQHSEYLKRLGDWALIDDACEGEKRVKSKRTEYLPKLNPSDTSQQNADRYEQYLKRATYYNATGRTKQGLVGSAFRKTPVLEIPESLTYVKDDIDGLGNSIYQQSQSVLASVISKGRHCLYVDYPSTSAEASRADLNEGSIKAIVVSIEASSVINWRTDRVGAVNKLTLVVISEQHEQVTEDGFGVETAGQYRVLKIEDGYYVVEIWRSNGKKYELVEAYRPTDGSGNYWRTIPFIFVGSENNDITVDTPPLLDMATLNIAHYRNSADYEDSCFFVGQAQPVITGLTEEWRNYIEKSGLYIGSRSPLLLPEGGSFSFAQVAPNTLIKEAMDTKERQMIALGARLVEKGQAVKTATEAQAEQEVQHSVLSLAVSNVNEAYIVALSWLAQFMGAVSDSINYEINQDFTESSLDSQMLTALVGAWQSGVLPSSDLWGQFRKYGVIDPEKSDEDIKDELETQGDGLNLDGIE